VWTLAGGKVESGDQLNSPHTPARLIS